jgi:glucose-6-phosphate 1-epimerase
MQMIVRSTWQGLETVLIDTPLARCEIALYGAQVLSFIPKSDGRDLLWCSSARLEPSRPVRGGAPICWPWFARQDRDDASAQHGFVRRMHWSVGGIEERADSSVRIVLYLDTPAAGWPQAADWPRECTPEFEADIGTALQLCLTTRNRSDRALSLTQALHTYFRVGDVRQTALEGLRGRRYLDKLRNFDEFEQHDEWSFQDACDRIYLDTDSVHRIDDPVLKRSIRIESMHSASTVVWNPGASDIAALTDVPLADWYQYLCVEAGNCAPLDRVRLAPGGTTKLVQKISSAAL